MDSSGCGASSTAAAGTVQQFEALNPSSNIEAHGIASRSEPLAEEIHSRPSTMDYSNSRESSTASAVATRFNLLGIDSSAEDHGRATHTESEEGASLFQYSPLVGASEIRLVILEPGRDDDPVKCRLIHVSLDENPVYEALSYTWGDASISGPTILLNGKPFRVGTNLGNALLNLRYNDVEIGKERTLWIDAICIDQRNITERNEQVQRMKSIYSNAIQVLIWLGNYHESSDNSFEYVEQVWGFTRVENGTKECIHAAIELLKRISQSDTQTIIEASQEGDAFSSETNQNWANVHRLFRRPWFERLWVVQELYLAREAQVICGQLTISWNEFIQACKYIGWSAMFHRVSILKRILITIQPARPVSHASIHNLQDRSIFTLLSRLTYLKCADPRDMIYGLMGICNDDQGIEVDYSNSVHDVYINWAWAQIDRSKRLDVLRACKNSKGVGLPSWVPNLENGVIAGDRFAFDSSGDPHSVYLDDSSGGLPYSASGRSLCSPEISRYHRHLSLSGIHIDSIKTAIKPILVVHSELLKLDDTKNDLDLPYALLTIERLETQVAKEFGLTHLDYDSATWTEFTDVLFRGLKSFGLFGDRPPEDLRDRYAAWRGFAPIHPQYKPELEDDARMEAYTRPLSVFLPAVVLSFPSLFFITDAGRIGVAYASSKLQVGDKVYVLFGAHTPYILRKDGQETFHQLMGPCYQHGLMDGEAIAGWRIGKYKSERITLV
jgi:hypothetical protein